ncbi:Enzymatic polyprotein [Sesamum angolense]|uniref:Enzymatic polyprotein n=1 Tax=Sesamum angolense TaxID=2727404 RepID=A0AAE2C082_9LAMI|nr:Enzymatic polyprotein [Sesamum angolense]
MEPNESSSYNDNREYFQILEKQRKDVLREILWKCDHGPYKGPCKMRTAPRTPEEPRNGDTREVNPEFDPEGPRHLRVLLEVPGQVAKRLQTTEINGPIPARRNGKADTKASILARDSKSAIADRLGRLIKIHFIGDGYFEESRTEKARENAQALFSLELRSICAVDEYIYWFRKYFFQSGVAVDVAAPMFFAKICSPWREMLIQSYKVPEGQMDSVARRMSFLKDKLKDWCYQASIQKNMKRLRGMIKRTPLCCDNNDFPTVIENQVRRGKGGNTGVIYTPGTLEELLLGADHGGPKPKPEHTNLGNGVDQQGLPPKDLDEQIQDPPDEPLRRELSDGPIPELMKVSRIATAGHVEQEDISLQIARRNVTKVSMRRKWLLSRMDLQPSQNNHNEEDRLQTSESLSGFFSRMTVSNKTMERIMRQDSNLSPYDGFRIGGISKVLNQIGLNQRKHHIIYKVSSGEFAIPMEFTGNVMEMQLIPKEEILEELSRLREEIAVTMKWIHIGTIEVQPVVGRYEGMLEIAGHEFLVAGVAGRENGCMILGLSFLEDHKPWGRKGNGMEFSLDGVRREKAFNRIMPINFRSKRGDFDAKLTNPKMQDKRKFGKVLLSFRQQGLIETDSFHEESEEELKNLKEVIQEFRTLDISEESILSLENVKRLIQRNFSENPLAWWDRNKIEATLKIKEECKYEYVRYKPIQMNMEDKKDMQIIIKEHISLGLIEPGISAYSSPVFLVRNHGEIKRGKPRNISDACHKEGLVLSEKKATIAVNKIEFLGILIDEAGIELQEHIVEKIRNFPDVLKDKKQLQSFLGVVNFAGIFIKDLAKYRKDFRPLLKETESAKWRWEEIHTQRVRELKQVCNNLPKLAIPQDEDELVVYTDANDYRWAAVLMKKTTTGEEPCRYTGGLFTEQQAQVWHINEKEFFAVWKAFKKWHLFLLAKEFTLKVDNTNVKAFLKNKLESKIEKAQMEGAEANSVMLRLRNLRENLEELDREFGRLAVNAQVAGQVQRADLDKVQTNIRSSLVASTALWNALLEPIRKASPSVMTRELREQGSKPALRVQGSRPVAADSSTACTRPSSDSGETATDESQGVKTSDDSSQPSTSGVKEERLVLGQ